MRISRLRLYGPLLIVAVAALIVGVSAAVMSGDEQDVPLTIGVDGGYSHWSDSEIDARTELGAAVTRFEWEPGTPLEESEETVLAAVEIDTRLHALLGANEFGDPIEYRDWVVEFIRYYGPNGTFWEEHPELDASRYAITTVELGNEPYLEGVSPAEYVDAIRPALEAIDDLELPVEVVVAAHVYGDDTSWVDGLYEHSPDLNALVDAFALHPYWYGHPPDEPGPAGPFERIETLREAIDSHGGESIPIQITEYGQSTAACGEECVSENEQAADLAAMIDAVTSNPDWKVEMLSIFQLIDRGTDTGETRAPLRHIARGRLAEALLRRRPRCDAKPAGAMGLKTRSSGWAGPVAEHLFRFLKPDDKAHS